MRRIRKGDAGRWEEDVKTETRPALSPFDRSFGSDFRERHPSPLRTLELAGQVRDGRRWKINGELHWDSVKMDSPLFSRAALSYRCILRKRLLRRFCCSIVNTLSVSSHRAELLKGICSASRKYENTHLRLIVI